jgi:hypothetical protein
MADNAEVWRKALRAKGKFWVAAELQRRPGLPRDAVYDIVFEEPYPTREFCQRWCAEEDNRIIRFSWETAGVLIFLVLAVVCSLGAVRSWNAPLPPTASPAVSMQTVPQTFSLGNSATPTNDVPSQSTAGSADSSSAGSLPLVCAYQTYETAACKR